MTAVETVRGPTDTAALGSVLMHEHVFVLGAEFRQNYPTSRTTGMSRRGSTTQYRSSLA
jgi:predicted metal-dependent phosphotriesterase family hydrolase